MWWASENQIAAGRRNVFNTHSQREKEIISFCVGSPETAHIPFYFQKIEKPIEIAIFVKSHRFQFRNKLLEFKLNKYLVGIYL